MKTCQVCGKEIEQGEFVGDYAFSKQKYHSECFYEAQRRYNKTYYEKYIRKHESK